MRIRTIVLIAMASAAATLAQAQGTISATTFSDNGSDAASGGANLATDTLFTFNQLQSNGSGTGYFGILGSEFLGNVTMNTTTPGGLTFAAPEFGSFTSTAFTEELSSPTLAQWLVIGNYSGGTVDPGVSAQASFLVTFTQATVISSSASFQIPPVPEPGTLALLGLGVSTVCVGLRRRKA
jgi:hypothetical protein